MARPALHRRRRAGPAGFPRHAVPAPAWGRRASSPALAAVLLIPTPVLFFLTLGTYSAVALAALLGGIGYALFGAVHALTGNERAYPGDWPARARPVPVAVAPDQRERRARWALGALIVIALLRWLVTRLAT